MCVRVRVRVSVCVSVSVSVSVRVRVSVSVTPPFERNGSSLTVKSNGSRAEYDNGSVFSAASAQQQQRHSFRAARRSVWRGAAVCAAQLWRSCVCGAAGPERKQWARGGRIVYLNMMKLL